MINIENKLEKPEPETIYEKIAKGFTFDLNKIKEIHEQLFNDNVKNYAFLLGFSQANFAIIPIMMMAKPEKLETVAIDGRVFDNLRHIPIEFMTTEQIVKRVEKWLNNWENLKGRYLFVPVIIAPSSKGWIWCTNNNKIVPAGIIREVEKEVK